MTTPDPPRSPREGLHSIWREAAKKRIDAGVDWPRIVLDLLNECDNLAARLSAQESAIRALADEFDKRADEADVRASRGDRNADLRRLTWERAANNLRALLDPSDQGTTT